MIYPLHRKGHMLEITTEKIIPPHGDDANLSHVACAKMPCDFFHVCVAWCQFVPFRLSCSSKTPTVLVTGNPFTVQVLFTQNPPTPPPKKKHLKEDIWLWEVFLMFSSQSWLSPWFKPWRMKYITNCTTYMAHKDMLVIQLSFCCFTGLTRPNVVWCHWFSYNILIQAFNALHQANSLFAASLVHNTKHNGIQGAYCAKSCFFLEFGRKPV